jgi:hypothetical protein
MKVIKFTRLIELITKGIVDMKHTKLVLTEDIKRFLSFVKSLHRFKNKHVTNEYLKPDLNIYKGLINSIIKNVNARISKRVK